MTGGRRMHEEPTFRRSFALVSVDVLDRVLGAWLWTRVVQAFADLAGSVLTIGAMHTQHDTAQLILGRGADYVMTVKANMPTLYKQLKKLPWAGTPSVSSVSTGRGRGARRTVKLALAPSWIS